MRQATMHRANEIWLSTLHELGYQIQKWITLVHRKNLYQSVTLKVPRISSLITAPIIMVFVSIVVGFSMGYDHALTSISDTDNISKLHEHFFVHDAPFTLPAKTIELLGQYTKEYLGAKNQLKEDYADYFGLFTDKAQLNRLFSLNEESEDRFVRRMVQKIVQKQITPDIPVTFTWVTAGDASAAGYGNRFEESYTSALHDTVRVIFAAVGLRFVAKNAGLGGYGSAPDLAFCMESVYGNDIDILTYDFGMMDGDSVYRAGFWGTRAAMHPSRPLLFMIDSRQTGRWDHFSRLQERGMGVALMDTAELGTIKKFLPDSKHVDLLQMDTLPEPLKFFICNGATEGCQSCYNKEHNYVCEVDGAEPCINAKFSTKGICEYEKYHASWLPGWKEHRFRGRLLGVFLANLLGKALLEVDRLFTEEYSHIEKKFRWQEILSSFEQQDKLDQFLFENSRPPDDTLGKYTEGLEGLDLKTVFTRPAECLIVSRTAQDMYDEIHDHQRKHNYEGLIRGSTGTKLEAETNHNYYASVNGGDGEDCKVLDIHHKESFFTKGDGWETIQVPISVQREERQGLIAVCFTTCLDVECLSSTLEGLDGIKLADGYLEIEVNGIKVKGSKHMDGCYFLEGEGNEFRWQPSDTGSYELRFKINEKNATMRIFTVITI